ncbi:MAG: hypothetical protein JSV00_07020 [bacterium]|nr:MAG: hypothetical protein JSV00_07020 [bacterium]
MRPSRTLPVPAAAVLLVLAVVLTLIAGWHREVVSRYAVSDLPYVNLDRIERQVRQGNVSRREAIYYRRIHAGADTAEIR